MPRTARKPLTEHDFILDPTGKQFLDYARYNIGSMISSVEMKWDPGQSGMSLDLFVNDAALYAIELAREDHAKGLFRNENADSFRKFFYGRILKAFHTKLEDLAGDPGRAVFDERLGKYYEGTAVEFGPMDDNDEPSVLEDLDKDTPSDTSSKRHPKKANDGVILYHYSAEKAKALEESHEIKMTYVRKIREIVARMSPNDQRLFNLKFQFDFSDQDYRMWETISAQKHVKDPFTKMAHDKYGFSEGYAKKRICLIKADIVKKLSEAGHTRESYRQQTSLPNTLEFLQARKPAPAFDLDIEGLSEADCRDILIELFA